MAREHAMQERVAMAQKAGDARSLEEHKAQSNITYGDSMEQLRPKVSDSDSMFKQIIMLYILAQIILQPIMFGNLIRMLLLSFLIIYFQRHMALQDRSLQIMVAEH